MSKDVSANINHIKLRREIGYDINHASTEIQQFDIDFDYLIEQAERVQELERINKQFKNNLSVYKGYYKNMIKINEDIVEENKRYREVFDLIKKTANDYKEGHLLDIQDSYFVDEITAIMENKSLEGDPHESS